MADEKKKTSKLDELKKEEAYLVSTPDPNHELENDILAVRQKIKDLENKQTEKIYEQSPSKSVLENPEQINLDYSEIMKNATGAYPKDQDELDSWKKNYANRSLFSTVPLETTAEETGIYKPDEQKFSDAVKSPDFQQFLKDMQVEAIASDRQSIADEGSKGVRGTLTEILYPEGMKSVREGTEYTPADAAVETAFNVGEAIPWGAPFKVGGAISKVLAPIFKASRKVEHVPFGMVANQTIMPAGRETYNALARDKDLGTSAADAGIGTAINVGTPLAIKGAFRSLSRGIKLPRIMSKFDKILTDVDKKRASEELAEETEQLYKKEGLNIPVSEAELYPSELSDKERKKVASDLSGVIGSYSEIAKKANRERAIAPKLVGTKAYADLIKELKFNENPLAESYHNYMVSATDAPIDNVKKIRAKSKTPEFNFYDELAKEENRIGKRIDPISAYEAWASNDPYITALRYNVPDANPSLYNENGKLTKEAKQLMDLKGTKDPLDLDRIGKGTQTLETVSDFAGMGKEFGLNAMGQSKDAVRVIPYVGDKIVESREKKKNIIGESSEEKESRWAKGYSTVAEQKMPEYKKWYETNIERLAD